MRFRTKLFLASTLGVFVLSVVTTWPILGLMWSNFDHLANTNFAGMQRGLDSLQAERIDRMRQQGKLVMEIPELRSLIAENNFEVSADNLASLQDRLNDLTKVMKVGFFGVLDARGNVIAQNSSSPWAALADLREYIAQADPAKSLVHRLFAPASAQQVSGQDQYGLWLYRGQLFQVVGIPLIFQESAPDQKSDGALLMASPITSEMAHDLAAKHNSEVTFITNDGGVISSLTPKLSRQLRLDGDSDASKSSATFDIRLGDTTYRSHVESLVDPCSGTVVGRIVSQTSMAEGISLQKRISKRLLAIMAGGILLAALASFLFSGAITYPIRELLRGVRRVADGDLTLTIAVMRTDEIGELATAFNEMVGQLLARRELELRVAESQAATQAKSQFLANMSHEIRTPLHGVIGMANLLLSTELNQRQRHYADLVKSSAEILTTLINDILDFSKMEAGKLELESMEFDLRIVLEDVVELLSQKAFAKGVEVACSVADGVPPLVRGDSNRLRQILMNLIGNAVKFTDRGEIIVNATLLGSEADRLIVRFEIIDTGPGIPQDRIERLFKSFSQVDASMTRRYGGTGLGLAISKQLAELMGGQIGVDSKLGNGSTFWFTAALQPVECSGAKPFQELAGLAVLVIHPSRAIQQIVRGELNRAGMIAYCAGSGAEAATLPASQPDAAPFSIVLVDRNVSDLEKLSSLNTPRRLLLTVPTDDLPMERLKSLGYAGSIIKPIRAAHLIETIAAAVSGRLWALLEKKTDHPESAVRTSDPSYRILLAEDNQINQVVASELLTGAGYGIVVVADGQAALQAFLDGKFDLILMDCQMPVLDGLEATRAIRAEETTAAAGSTNNPVPIVALTANASNVDRDRCMEAGMNGYFQKPFRPRDLLDTVARYLKESQPPLAPRSAGVDPAANVIATNNSHTPTCQIPHSPAPNTPLQKSILLESCSNSVDLASTILLRFEKQLSDAIGQFTDSISRQDGEALARLSHSLKGAAGIIGAEPLRLALGRMEQLARSGQLDLADKQWEQLRAEIDRCSAAAVEVNRELKKSVSI